MFRKKIILFVLSVNLNLASYAQTQLWGMTREGGQYNAGVIFKTDGSGNNYNIEHSFYKIDGGNPMRASLLAASDGMLYGMTFTGGVHNEGVLFQYNPVTSAYIKKIEFDSVKGSAPHGSLLQANDGMLYGVTCEGGVHNMGVLFQYDPVTSVYTKKLDFDGTGNGACPRGALVQAKDGMLYGLTGNGGTHDMGVLFQYDPVTSTCLKKFDFDGVNGISPRNSLIQANDGMLYGMTYEGGADFVGVIFQYNPLTSACIKKFDFDGTENGRLPHGSLIQATDGMLYGMTAWGGVNDEGVLFQYNPVTSAYNKKLDFNSTVHGAVPVGALLQVSDGILYGLTSSGGATDNGVLFQYNLDSSAYIKKFEFDFINGNSPNGYLVKANDGLFYGMTYGGGVNDRGVIFQYDPATATCTKKLDFFDAVNGGFPSGSLIQASDGMLYGMTREGGANQSGVIFQYNPVASIYTKKFDFDGAVNGSGPTGDLMQASNGMFYGMTERGGLYDEGVLFQYNPVTFLYTKKFDFDEAVNGSRPYGSLIQAIDGMLYGMTYAGGANSLGVLFQYDPVTSAYTKKLDFDGAGNGSLPLGSLLQTSDGMLYGTTVQTIFQYNPGASAYTKQFEFDIINGSGPTGFLIQASDGILYGMTRAGGAYSRGVIFQYDPATAAYTRKFDFGNLDGSMPYGSLIQANDGMFYGIVSHGGTKDKGVLFQYNPVTSSYIKKLDFNGSNGAYPHYTHLIEIDAPNGIAENDFLNSMTVFPNPTEGVVNLQIEQFENLKMKSIEVYNVLGKKIHSSNNHFKIEGYSNFQIDISSQPDGVYFLKVKTPDGVGVKKIVKQ